MRTKLQDPPAILDPNPDHLLGRHLVPKGPIGKGGGSLGRKVAAMKAALRASMDGLGSLAE